MKLTKREARLLHRALRIAAGDGYGQLHGMLNIDGKVPRSDRSEYKRVEREVNAWERLMEKISPLM